MKKGLLILLYIGLPFLLVAQNGENELKFQRQVWLQKQLTVPPSPEAASLGRYGENDFQVNKYTGGYTKTIPIYSIQGKELSWNIRLSYNPNGVKVDNMPGWVGLGWTLNAGGSVTRSVKGIPETKDNYFDKKDIIERYQNLPPAETDNDEDSAGPPEFQDYLYRVIDNTIELQPDNFYYNANSGGISGKYFIKYDKSIVQKQVGDVAIFPTYEPDMDVKSISIKDRNGTTYNFTIPEETQLRLADITGDPTPIQFSYDYNSTWHLSSVTNANQTEKLIFKYHTADAAYDLSQFINQHQYASKTYQNVTNQHNACPVENGTSANGGATSETSIKNRRHLKEIIYVLGTDTLERVLFTSVKNNCTYADATSRRLDRIRVQRGENGAVGILDFDLTYNTTENGTCTEGRLLLQKIQEFQSSDLPRSNSTIERKEPYVFTYNNGAFPNPATTVSMDHWSFFNGNGGSSLVPNGIYPSCDKTDKAYNGGGDRRTDAVKIKTLVLNKIEYPTGGYTSLEIEPHLIAPYFCWENNEMYGGGLRIESISNYDCDGTLLTKKTYKYKQSNGSSSGKLLSPLQYDRPSIYKHFDEKNIGGGGIDYMCSKTVLSAINRSQIGATQDALVGYDRVECIIEGNDNSGETLGKTVYHFRNKTLGIGDYENVENGLIDKVSIYNTAGDILSESFYEYSLDLNEKRNNKVFYGAIVTPKTTQNNKKILCEKNAGNWQWELITQSCANTHQYDTKYEVSRRYAINQRWVYKRQTTQRNYFYNAQNVSLGYVETIENQVYGDTAVTLPTETSIINSDGQSFKTLRTYTHSDALADPILKHPRRHQVALPFTEARYINNQLYYKTRIGYEDKGFRDYYPTKFYEIFGNQTQTDSLQAKINQFDQYGNIRESQAIGGQPSTQIWSNRGSRLAASIINAGAGEVAYTSFETRETYQGGWIVPNHNSEIRFNRELARIGAGFYQPFNPSFAGEVISTIVNGGRYVLSYYTTNPTSVLLDETGITVLRKKITKPTEHPSNWHYVEYLIELDSRKAVKVNVEYHKNIDELRLHPADALMTTYAYDKDSRLPISVMDANSLPSKFHYDGLLRLIGVQNFDDDYISTTEYLYKNSQHANNAIKNWTSLKSGVASLDNLKTDVSGDVLQSVAYFDGIGRSQLNIGVAQSPSKKDIISFQVYDKFGRQTTQYLPYTKVSDGGNYRTIATAKTEQRTFLTNQTDYDNGDESYGFVKTELEASPLNRVFKQRPTGKEFQAHPVETQYRTNKGEKEVRNFYIMGFYAPNSLYKTTQKDENGNRITTYTDKIGRKVMQDQEGSKTYFLYNNQNLLKQVIQPEAAQKGHTTPTLTYDSPQIKEGSFLYTYDEEYRMKTKVVPNCAAYTYYYDDLDQLIMTVDGNGFKTFTKYDKIGRPILTGRYKGDATPTTEVVYEERNSVAPHYYTTTKSFPSDGDIDVYTVTYYDDYDINRDNTEEINYESDNITNADYPNYPYVRGLPTASKVAILKNDASTPTVFLNAYTFYDQFRRVVHSRKDNHIGGQDKVWSNYNFAGWLMKTKRLHTSTIGGQTTTKNINERWEYDHIGRELKYYQAVAGDQAEKLICEKEYNERDELKTKKLGNVSGTNFLQTVDYEYNIRKWLTKINDPKNLGSDLFGMHINYRSIQNFGDQVNYNGNIGSIIWKNGSDNIEKEYAYHYDKLNRLTSANYKEEAPVVTGVLPTTNQYNTTYSYDRNGNIKTLTRNGFTGTTFAKIDDLAYNYDNDGGLRDIKEVSNKDVGFKSRRADGFGLYTYDQNGNMLTDLHKGMMVSYNHLNLPKKVTKPEGTIEWVYDAAGTKLSKTVVTKDLEVNANPILSKEYKAQNSINSKGTVAANSNVTFTAGQCIKLTAGFSAVAGSDFLARILGGNIVQVRDYCSGLEYLDAQIEAIYYGDGRVKYDGNSSEREYILSDYQGNNRVLFKDNGSGSAEQIEGYSYYPFGAVHGQKRDYLNNYLNEGKELQTELSLDWSDYHLRCKDNWMGRFIGIDVLADSYSSTSPYSYGLGNPIRNGDPTGASVQTFTGEEAQQVFKGVQNNYNDAVASGQNVNFKSSEIGGLASIFMNGGGGGNDPIIHNGGDLPIAEVTASNLFEPEQSSSRTMAAAALAFISTDAAVPEPTDAAWLKWAGYAIVGTGASAVLYFADDATTGTGANTKPITVTTSGSDGFNYVTYLKINPTNGFVYVGRSSGYGTPANIVKRRDSKHHMTSKGYGPAVLSTFAPATIPGGYARRALDPSYWAIRGSEQLQIEHYRSLGISGNINNGIGPNNPDITKYFNAAKNALKPK